MTQSSNPLKQFFRQPAIYMRLPSGGQFWTEGSLDMPPNRELAVYPMTAIDEITYRTPDALFNGSAVVSVIQSCVPSVKNAWKMPAVDVNSILVAIRIASYGQKMELNTDCPACKEENEFEIDLNMVLSSQQPPDYSDSIKYNDLEIFFRPISYDDQNQINMLQFEQQRIMQSIPDSNLTDDEKSKKFNESLQAITKITIKALKSNIGAIRTPQALVSEPDFIEEFLVNCDRKLYNQIRDHVVSLRSSNEFKPLKMTCSACSHNFEQDFTLDSTSFFADAS